MNFERPLIEQELERVLQSPSFAAAPKMQALLRYIVEATLDGQAERLKGYTIGVDVFERPASFDPGTDSIVRVQVGRLRALLKEYYAAPGCEAALRIEIPKGNYGAQFHARGAADNVDVAAPAEIAAWARAARTWITRRPWALGGALAAVFAVIWLGLSLGHMRDTAHVTPTGPITLAILPLADMSTSADARALADALTENLTTAMARTHAFTVASRSAAAQYDGAADLRVVGQDLNVRYVLEGSVQREREALRVNVQLIDSRSGAHLWAERYTRSGEDVLALQDDVVAIIASELRIQLLSAARPELEARAARGGDPWALYLAAAWSPGASYSTLVWEEERAALARRALEIDPDFGQAHAVLADKLAYLANVDPGWDTPANRREARRHARRALDLAPDDADAMFNVAVHYWHAGDIEESENATRRTLELNPHHPLAELLVDVVRYTCAPAPQAAIDALIARDAALSPDNPARWLTLTWLNILYLNNGDLERAAEAGRRAHQVFVTPTTLYRYAATLVALGRTDEASLLVEEQSGNWPHLDARRYADVVIRRSCAGAAGAAGLYRRYSDLADALDGARVAARP